MESALKTGLSNLSSDCCKMNWTNFGCVAGFCAEKTSAKSKRTDFFAEIKPTLISGDEVGVDY